MTCPCTGVIVHRRMGKVNGMLKLQNHNIHSSLTGAEFISSSPSSISRDRFNFFGVVTSFLARFFGDSFDGVDGADTLPCPSSPVVGFFIKARHLLARDFALLYWSDKRT